MLFGLGETMLQPTVPAIVNDLASDRDRGPLQRGVAGRLPGGRHHGADRRRASCSTAQLGGVFIAVIVAGLGGVAVLALALERRITPEVNGILDEPVGAAAARAEPG